MNDKVQNIEKQHVEVCALCLFPRFTILAFPLVFVSVHICLLKILSSQLSIVDLNLADVNFRPLFEPVEGLIMVALCNRADRYIFAL